MALARRYGGLAILWEHRFYGQSLPFELDLETGIAVDGYEAYKYHTVEQALQDTVYFSENFHPPTLSRFWSALSPHNTPWVFIGGSYPGIRAALARKRNPETWFASWASSAPVQAQVDMSVYYSTMQHVIPRNCSMDLHAAVTHADTILDSGTHEEIAEVRQAVYMTGLLVSSDSPGLRAGILSPYKDFPTSPSEMSLWTIAQILAIPFQHTSRSFQMQGFSQSLRQFCDDMEHYNIKSAPPFPSPSLAEESNLASWVEFLESPLRNKQMPTSVGLATTHNSSTAFNALLSAIYRKVKDERSKESTSPLGASPFPADRISWMWQYCSEFGYLQVGLIHNHHAILADKKDQVANISNPLNFISRFYNVSSTQSLVCKSIFPYLPTLTTPNVSSINQYGGWNISVSNVMFSNGQYDPWRVLGVHADTTINPSALIRQSTKLIPKCNDVPQHNAVFGQCYGGQVHVSDLLASMNTPISGQPSPFELGFILFSNALKEWFQCFNNSN
ncbi:hypothetical protein PENPOL_c003G04071 [Penicillium polonicum]|uniref:Serine carboxypeptidase S28 n=1 Tax=Penicillium polonicum TaxID=60169 RepID=A0A1V6NT13_PENPO|nr:hypothetical protein PENPOL_c003G04071 [Penicillium polonicum]